MFSPAGGRRPSLSPHEEPTGPTSSARPGVTLCLWTFQVSLTCGVMLFDHVPPSVDPEVFFLFNAKLLFNTFEHPNNLTGWFAFITY